MGEKYRLTAEHKKEIAQNLIDIQVKDSKISDRTAEFIYKWCRSGPEGKTKAFFDVWDIVLKNYMPKTWPILFRSCNRRSGNGKIASFTGRLECARRFSEGKGSLIICDTKEVLQFEEQFYKLGHYKHSFYPLVKVLQKEKDLENTTFHKMFLDEFIGEDEYIMRVNLGIMHSFKWMKDE